MQDMLWRGVVHIQAGDQAEGKHLLTLVVQLEPDNAVAWLWLASVASSEEERLAALQRVVEINPDDAAGRHAQTLLRRDVVREVAGRIPPPAPPREVPRARPALPPPPPAAPVARAPVPVPAERPRANRGGIVLLLAGVIATCMAILLLGSTLLLYGGVEEQATPTRVIIERTRAPATPRPPTPPPVPSPTLAPPPPPTRTPNPRFGACGRDPALADQPIFLCLDSEPGDPVGGRQARRFTPADSGFTVQWTRDRAIEVRIAGADPWDLVFQVPYGLQISPGGSYERIDLADPQPSADLPLLIQGPGGSCASATSRVALLALQYTDDQITLFAADFEQHCAGDPPGLYGTLLYQAAP
jgi:hypothetical protein